MGGSQKGLSFRDLLCGLVVLTKGELEEKIKCTLFRLCRNLISMLSDMYKAQDVFDF